MTKVYVVGASGFVGAALIQKLNVPNCTVVSVGRCEEYDYQLDLLAPENFRYEDIQAGDFVVFTAAISSPDVCVNQFEFARSVNVDGTTFFISKAIEAGAKVLFLSSDAVYESDSRTIYDEDSATAPQFNYGLMKAEVEEFFCEEARFKSLRLSYVYSKDDKFTSYLVSCFKEGKVAEVFHPYYRNAVALSDVVSATSWLIDNWQQFPSGVINLAGEELVSRLEMADEFKNYVGDSFAYSVVVPNDSFYKARPKVTRVKSRYLFELSIIQHGCFAAKYWNELKGIVDND